MAEGYLKFYAGGKAAIVSAGLKQESVHPLAINIMQEDKIDISFNTSKTYHSFLNTKFDYLLILCNEAKQNRPKSIHGRKVIHFDIPDLAKVQGSEEEKLIAFREARESIKKFVLRFIGKELMEEAPMFS